MEIEKIAGIQRLESMISLEESINDKKRLMKSIFTELTPKSRVNTNNGEDRST